MLDSKIELGLALAAGLALLWQFALVWMGVAMLRSGEYTKVTIGFIPGALAAILITILLVIA